MSKPLALLFALGLIGCGAGADGSSLTQATSGTTPSTVIVHYPAGWGNSITLRGAGAGLSWSSGTATTWTTGDAWTLTLNLSQPVDCKPLFNDQTWAIGPNWTLSPGQTLDIWPHFFTDAGSIQVISNWYSQTLNANHDIFIYTPPSYGENGSERYPVVYMHDGQNLFYDDDSATGVSWNVGGAMDQGASDASIHEAIIIGIANNDNRTAEYTPVADPDDGGGDADAYLDFIVNELKPQMDQQFRTFSDAGHTAMIGSSLGGLVTAYAGATRSGTFGFVGVMSPSTWWDNFWVINEIKSTGGRPERVYLDSGDSGTDNDDVTYTAQLADSYRSDGYRDGSTLDYVVQMGGQHGEQWWRERVPGALGFLLGGR